MMKAAEQDYGYAQFKMGDYYFFGCGPCLEDNKKAMEWYEKAVANEIPMAMLRMGEYYLYDYDSLNESEKASRKLPNTSGIAKDWVSVMKWVSEWKIMKRKLLNIIRWLRIMEIR
jgi:TPR repeat protein